MIRYKSLRHAFFTNCPEERHPDECWEWQGNTMDNDYGSVGFDNEFYLAHRLSYKLHRGQIPDGLHVCHSCDNPKCVNPSHLWLGTNAENMRDKVEKGREAHVKGAQQGQSKLKFPQVWAMRLRYQEGVSQTELARRYGISQSNVSRIVRGVAWSYATMP